MTRPPSTGHGWASCSDCTSPVHPDDRFCETCGARRPDPRDRVELVADRLGAVSDRGVRHRHNEDAVGIRSVSDGGRGSARITVVCDGVSRGARPDLASQAAVDAALDVLVTGVEDPDTSSRAAVRAASSAVVRLSTRAPVDLPPACTFVSAVVVGRTATVASVGDSRVYWLPRSEGGARPLTVDDSWRHEAVATGSLGEAAAARDRRRHAITAWLGADAAPLDPRVTTVHLDAPGVLVACTDGLWNRLRGPDDLAELVASAPDDPLAVARRLVGEALDRAELDNITAAVIDVPAPTTDTDLPEES
ncbi:protein phosphatase 2C domain-containing protein [Actinomycetospora termitidis]|uniref:Protein phosphatase 2C domain-containing protein n=1 Tax=Actinomycetospora termitidis TaxID=3053470 RepID=A0ABT7ME23_9PSEU|nr:protein phosphatase 2C domain-containing protein [Actinomycetospora sp. Odt1-22]MDL5158919.1 protein phosphatase 2C domain-containing protein [Actinomycetospora sp. Odt1-22]